MLVAKGYAAEEVSAMTGTGLSRIYTLSRDPSFKELVRFYLNADGDVHRDLMVKMEDIARDAFEELHTRLQEAPTPYPRSSSSTLLRSRPTAQALPRCSARSTRAST
jgi:hypothetical protein